MNSSGLSNMISMGISGRTTYFARWTESLGGAHVHSEKMLPSYTPTWYHDYNIEFSRCFAIGHQSFLQKLLFPLSTMRFSNQFSRSFINGPKIMYIYIYDMCVYIIKPEIIIFYFKHKTRAIFLRSVFVFYYTVAPFFKVVE